VVANMPMPGMLVVAYGLLKLALPARLAGLAA
jgi:hypothetical protein